MLKSINPATGEEIKTYKEMSLVEIDSIIIKVKTSFLAWQDTDFSFRKSLMKKAADVLRNNKSSYAELMTVEMGKPIKQSFAEVEKCAWVCDYFADYAENFLMDEQIETDASKSFVTFQPLGVVLAIMPWNFPFWQVFRFAAPNLMAGNAGILKHSSSVTGCALAIEEIFREAEFPENLFRSILVGSKRVKKMIQHPAVKAVTLTGSTPAGQAVAA